MKSINEFKLARNYMRLLPLSSALLLSPMAIAQDVEDVEKVDKDALKKIERIEILGKAYGDLETLSSQPLTRLSGEELIHRRQGTLGETLNGMPGIHLDSFGAGASKPVIRGQTVPRIEILSDGAQVFDASSASPDHAVVTDPLLLDAIEVVKGPVAAIYGGSAMNGVVNLIDSKVPKRLPEEPVTGAAEVRFGSGDDEKTYVGRMTAALGDFAFHIEGSDHSSNNYDLPSGYGQSQLKDSFADSDSFSLGSSWITDNGYIGIAYTRQNANYGLPGHSHANGVCHTHGLDLHCEAHGSYEDPFGSSDDHTAQIDLQSDRVDLRGAFQNIIAGIENIKLRASYTDYSHAEVDGPSTFSRYTNDVWDGRVELTHKPLWGFIGTFGVQYTDGNFGGINVNNLHTEFPENAYGLDGPAEYLTKNMGIFVHEARSFGDFDIEFAARKDWREIDVGAPPFRANLTEEYKELFTEWYGADWFNIMKEQEIGYFQESNPGAKHNPFSVSAGVTWHLQPNYDLMLSVARSERAPAVRELYARGNNLATNSYELGLAADNPLLADSGLAAEDVMETANSIDVTLHKNSGALQFELGIFYKNIDDYVFARLMEIENETGTPHKFLIYTAAETSFRGVDGQISFQATEQSRVTVFGDYVDAELDNADDNLPRISPSRVGARYDWESGAWLASVEYYHVSKQDDIASYETPTESYNMANLTLSYSLNNDNSEIYLRATNLTDELAYVHTSFVKDQSPLRGRNVVLGLRHQF